MIVVIRHVLGDEATELQTAVSKVSPTPLMRIASCKYPSVHRKLTKLCKSAPATYKILLFYIYSLMFVCSLTFFDDLLIMRWGLLLPWLSTFSDDFVRHRGVVLVPPITQRAISGLPR